MPIQGFPTKINLRFNRDFQSGDKATGFIEDIMLFVIIYNV